MRIMVLNGWGGALHGPLVAYLRDAAPDVLCLQEVTCSAGAQGWLTYRDGDHVLPQRADLMRDVGEALPGHAAAFCPAARGVLWDGDRAVPSLWGLATFVRRDLPVVAQAQGFVHGAFSPDGHGDHPRPRTGHAVRLFDPDRGRAVTVAHMHGLRDLAGKTDTPAREAQARRFAGLIARVAEPGDGVVAGGDLNVEPGSRTFGVLAEMGLRDLVVASGADGTRTSHYPKAGRFADYLLVNEAVEVLGFEVVREPEVSDHRPLLLTI